MIQKKNECNFLFYDYETFGLHPAIDKPSQFACIKTDFSFNIIENPITLYCYPPNDYLPDIKSILLTGITPQYTFKYGMNEFFFSKKIFNILNTKNTCIIGYNNIRFDDEVTRNIFYRNLLDPYSWSWRNNNSRWDLLLLVRACYILSPTGIVWPKNTQGFISFKLQDLTIVNNIVHHNSHDALSDVYACLYLIKIFKKKKPELFNFFFKYRLKNQIQSIINIPKKEPIIYISNIFGYNRNYLSCIIPIMWNENNSNMLIFFDLYYNVDNLISYLKNIQICNIRLDQLRTLGINYLYINQCPILIPLTLLHNHKLFTLGINLDECFKKIYSFYKESFLIQTINIFFKEVNYQNYKKDVDLRIYDNFFLKQDQQVMSIIHSTKINKLNNQQFYFQDVRLKEIFFRLRARNFKNLLNSYEKKKWLLYRLNIFNQFYLNDYVIYLEHLFIKYHNDIKAIKLLKYIKEYILYLFK